MKIKSRVLIHVFLIVGIILLEASLSLAQGGPQGDIFKTTIFGVDHQFTGGEGRTFVNPGGNPGICNEEDGGCEEGLSLGIGREGSEKQNEFPINGISPMTQVTENIHSQAFADQITESADSALSVNYLSMAYTDPGFFSAMKDSIDASIGIAQARYQADMQFHAKARLSNYEQFFNQTYEGCLRAYLSGSGGNKATTYAEAQEMCLRGSTAKPQESFNKQPSGDWTKSMTFAHFLDLPNDNGILKKDYFEEPEDGETKIRLSGVIFNREIEAQGGLNSEKGGLVEKLRKQFRGYLGDYLLELKYSDEVASGVKIFTKKLAPEFEKAKTGGFDAIRKALFEQAYHSIYAFEYAHCLVANEQASSVFPQESSETLTEANFWNAANKHSKGKGSGLLSSGTVEWVTDGRWKDYDENNPLQLNKRTFMEHAAGLSVGNSTFDAIFEASLWKLVRKRFLPNLSKEETNYCRTQLASWDNNKIPQNWNSDEAKELEALIVYLAGGIADAQIYSFLGEMLWTIERVSSGAPDENMRNMAKGMIAAFMNYADGGVLLNDALGRVSLARAEIERLAAQTGLAGDKGRSG